jgi:predicted adenylyl cyclase CyaB
MRNIEIKAKYSTPFTSIEKLILANHGAKKGVLQQTDYFFNVPKSGKRLKLRIIETLDSPSEAQLISYDRANETGPKLCDYVIYHTDDPFGLLEALTLSLGVTVQVKKTRVLYLIDQTRIHLDTVSGLGNFIEFEVVLRDSQSVEDGQAIAHDLMKKLEIPPESLCDCAYADLLIKERNTSIASHSNEL